VAPKCPGTSPERGSAQRWFFIGVISPKREIKNSKIKVILEGFNRQHIFGSAREMFLWSAHEKFQKHFTGRSKNMRS
jgi:hypothetical protein